MSILKQVLFSIDAHRTVPKGEGTTTSLRITKKHAEALKELCMELSKEAEHKVTPSALLRTVTYLLIVEGKGISPKTIPQADPVRDPEPSLLGVTADNRSSAPANPDITATAPEPPDSSVRSTTTENPLMEQIINSSLSDEEREIFDRLSSSSKPLAKGWNP
jgi:hypothetical protein